MNLGIASVAAITVLCYLFGMIVRASGLDNKWIPVLCGVLGMVLAAAAVIVAHLMDDTIKNDQDIRKYLHLNTLAVLPKEQRVRKNPEQTEPKP